MGDPVMEDPMSPQEGLDESRPMLVLVGAPGAGKSTVGRRVAEQLGVTFVDTDLLIEAESGMSVSDIFVTLGEPDFRRREEEAVAGALRTQRGVVALGGGAVLSAATRSLLAGHRVVWLRVSMSEAATRVGMNTARPLLLGNVRTTLSSLLEARSPLYEEVSSAVVDTSDRKLREVIADVTALATGGPADDAAGTGRSAADA
jgi:shikimate kinase